MLLFFMCFLLQCWTYGHSVTTGSGAHSSQNKLNPCWLHTVADSQTFQDQRDESESAERTHTVIHWREW
jgi:hypothetical protein